MATVYEYAGNMHMHTPYSDGEGSHRQIAAAALQAGLDFIIVTDHNVLVQGVEGYYGDDSSGYVLLLTGEEIHDQARLPQVNHMLVYGAERELAQCAKDPQQLIDAVNTSGGVSFLAHPHDPPLLRIQEPPILWEDWHVQHYTGLEIWNYMSTFKGVLNECKSYREILKAVFYPEDKIIGPPPETLTQWDTLLSQGRYVVGIGNADAHASTYRLGPLTHVVFPYDFLFSCVNTHLLISQPLSGSLERDKTLVYKALKQGNAFIGYDLIGSTRGFRFSAAGDNTSAIMGGRIRLGAGVTLQMLAPDRCKMKLIHNGKVVLEGRESLSFTAQTPGAYRVEAWKPFKGRDRAWILSNPIYVEDTPSSMMLRG